MRAPQADRLTWQCRAADRLGLTAELRGGGSRKGERWGGLLAWLLRRHVARCPRCQAELAGWRRIAALLQASSGVQAPAGTLDRVMARIAAEQDQERAVSEGPRREPLSLAGAAAAWLAWVFAVSLQAAGALGLLLPAFPGLTDRVFALVRAAFDSGGQRVREAAWMLQRAGETLPPGVAPYVEAVWWCAAGLSFAIGVLIVTGGRPGPRRE